MTEHPEHQTFIRVAPPRDRNPEGLTTVAIPVEPIGVAGWKRRRRCRKAGGHWWHSTDAMIGWGCCSCGARRDGMPRDGS